MWPFEMESTEDTIEDINPKEYEIDFDTGQLTGRIVEGSRALAMWAWLAIQTEKEKFYAYSWNYGCEIFELIGKTHSIEYLESEVSRMLTECLTQHKYITGIESLEISQEKDELEIKFRLLTDLGEEEIHV